MVLAHGLTNSCRELSRLTPFVPGTKVRFCFRGHGHSSSPEHGYRLEDFDRAMLADLNIVGVPRAIREVIDDWPLRDREDMRKVTAPTLLICREGDVIHPAEVGRILAGVMPNAELMVFDDGMQMYEA